MTEEKKSKKFAAKISNWINDKIANIALCKEFFLKKKLELKQHIATVKEGLKDLRSTNLALAFYHLNQGNINDAILRFKIIDILVKPNDEETHYGLSWCYFLKGNYQKALEHLSKAGNKDNIGLGYFMTNYQSLAEVPEGLWSEYRHITAAQYNMQWVKYPSHLPKEFVDHLFDKMEELPKQCKIMDLGCASGLVGSAIDYKLQKNYYLIGVDNISDLTDEIKNLREDKRQVYDELQTASVKKFFNANMTKQDIIISFTSLGFTKNLAPYFANINRMLNKNGYFALLLNTAQDTLWSPKKSCFLYSSSYIKNQLMLAEFKILDIKEWHIDKNNIYTMFIVKK